ncbi:larval cuticle protein LCP-17-like [Euwallacea similis]|uniref:larval cuticle protein LCP-17-like n=1 Tax=Euwallacea similis TaxID=1736056 RepID=UPI003450F20E
MGHFRWQVVHLQKVTMWFDQIKVCLVAIAAIFPDASVLMPLSPDYSSAKTLKYFSDSHPSYSYQYAYETDNGIYAEQRATLRNPNSNDDAKLLVTGSYQYQSPEGVPINLVYTADENGFRPQGEHLPTPPPIPPQILRALAWIKEHQRKEQDRDDIKEEFFSNVG